MIVMENTNETDNFTYDVTLKVVKTLNDKGTIHTFSNIDATCSVEAEYIARNLYRKGL